MVPVTRMFTVLAICGASLLASTRQLRAQVQPAANTGDSAAVLAVAHGIMKAISTQDTALARALMLPGAQLSSIADPAGANQAARTQSDTQFLNTLASSKVKFQERIWDATVWIHGPLAIVRAPYDFHLDGAFSHCGVDVLTMLKSHSEWRITHIVYTTQRAGCAPSPLGPPA